jgi:hypothetical protein
MPESEHSIALDIHTDDRAGYVHKADVMFLNNGWNDKNERIVISIGENAASYKWMHERCSLRHRIVYMSMNVLLIVVSTGLSAETIIPHDKDNLTMTIFRRIFTYIVTTISILQNFFKSQELVEKHSMYANLFSELYHDIQQQMCMYRRDRVHATKFVAERLKQYDSLVVNGPDIDRGVLKLFKTTFQNSDIALPDIADRIQKIEIITEPSIYPRSIMTSHDESIQDNNQHKEKHFGERCNNLEGICNAFQNQGGVSDKDIDQASPSELKEIRCKLDKPKHS